MKGLTVKTSRYIYIFLLLPVAPNLEGRASVKRFVSLQFFNHNTVGRTPWTGDQHIARPLPTQDNTNKNKSRHIHTLSGIRTHNPTV
jgi:hypothetical protein